MEQEPGRSAGGQHPIGSVDFRGLDDGARAAGRLELDALPGLTRNSGEAPS